MRDSKGRFIKGYKHPKEIEEKRLIKVRAALKEANKKRTPEQFKKAQEAAWAATRNKPSWNAGLAGYKEKEQHWAWGKKREEVSGENHWNWKGGITGENKKQRDTATYYHWRKQVFERDNYTCKICGVRGGVLHADHIKPFSLFTELRYDINNGRTLCISCHRQTPTYGNHKNLKIAIG